MLYLKEILHELDPKLTDYELDGIIGEVDGDNSKQVSELLKNPALMEALQGKLGQMVGMNSGYIAVISL